MVPLFWYHNKINLGLRLLLDVAGGLILSLDIPLDCHDKTRSITLTTEFNLKCFLFGKNTK